MTSDDPRGYTRERTVHACPECDSTQIQVRAPSMSGPDEGKTYLCRDCGDIFRRPAERAAQSHSGLGGLAGRLERAKADEVGDPRYRPGGSRHGRPAGGEG